MMLTIELSRRQRELLQRAVVDALDRADVANDRMLLGRVLAKLDGEEQTMENVVMPAAALPDRLVQLGAAVRTARDISEEIETGLDFGENKVLVRNIRGHLDAATDDVAAAFTLNGLQDAAPEREIWTGGTRTSLSPS